VKLPRSVGNFLFLRYRVIGWAPVCYFDILKICKYRLGSLLLRYCTHRMFWAHVFPIQIRYPSVILDLLVLITVLGGSVRKHTYSSFTGISTFRAHSGHIQVELKWTPVGPHPNCKKHLKKVAGLMQNTTCPHGCPSRGLTSKANSGNIQSTSRAPSGNIHGTSIGQSGNTIRAHSGNIQLPFSSS
jgi:hypothetical protein